MLYRAMKEEFENLVESEWAVLMNRRKEGQFLLPPLPGSHSFFQHLGACPNLRKKGKTHTAEDPLSVGPSDLNHHLLSSLEMAEMKVESIQLSSLGTRAPQAMFRSFPFWKIPIPSNWNDSDPQNVTLLSAYYSSYSRRCPLDCPRPTLPPLANKPWVNSSTWARPC